MSNRKVWTVALGVGVLLIFGAWYLLYGPKPLPKLPSDEEVKAQTSNWPEYVNKSYGFKVRIPPNAIEASWFGYDGVAFESTQESIDKGEYFLCTVFAWPSSKKNLFSDDDISWKESVLINGREAERRHQIGHKRNFEYIVIEADSYIFELEAEINDDVFVETCELIFSTFEILD